MQFMPTKNRHVSIFGPDIRVVFSNLDLRRAGNGTLSQIVSIMAGPQIRPAGKVIPPYPSLMLSGA